MNVLAVIGALALGSAAAQAADGASGSGALALGALIGLASPNIAASDKAILSDLLDGKSVGTASTAIVVKAAAVTCRASDVAIARHDCTLRFGSTTRTLAGRPAHELYATLIENGVGSDGAAGSIFEAVSALTCTIKPAVVQEQSGGGADCTYTAGPGS